MRVPAFTQFNNHRNPCANAVLWLLLWLSAPIFSAGFLGENPVYPARGLAIHGQKANTPGLLADEIGLNSGGAKCQGLQPHQDQDNLTGFTSLHPTTCVALPRSSNPAEESELKPNKEGVGWHGFSARSGLPDKLKAGHHGREPGDEGQALPLYDLYCSWKAYLAQT